jgi:hypothetical protein
MAERRQPRLAAVADAGGDLVVSALMTYDEGYLTAGGCPPHDPQIVHDDQHQTVTVCRKCGAQTRTVKGRSGLGEPRPGLLGRARSWRPGRAVRGRLEVCVGVWFGTVGACWVLTAVVAVVHPMVRMRW